MKRLLLLFCSVMIAIACFSKEPAWLTNRISEEAYIGVGSAAMNMPLWEQKAEEIALANLAQQISIIIETNSFLATVEINNSDMEYFEQNTKISAKNLLNGYELVGTYKDEKTNTFFVCYQLDKQTYLYNKQQKEKEIADAGYGYLLEAQKALNAGDIKTLRKQPRP